MNFDLQARKEPTRTNSKVSSVDKKPSHRPFGSSSSVTNGKDKILCATYATTSRPTAANSGEYPVRKDASCNVANSDYIDLNKNAARNCTGMTVGARPPHTTRGHTCIDTSGTSNDDNYIEPIGDGSVQDYEEMYLSILE